MTEPVARAVVDAFYKAYADRDIETVAQYIGDDVEWTISGPVDVLKFAGTYHGKAAVLDLMARLVPEVFQIFCFVPSMMLVDGDRVASFNRLWAKRTEDGRVISYRLAHFMRFEGGKVVENFSLIDSFDAVEQVLGHQLDVHGGRPAPGNRVAL
ncbi:MAG TPA: nuclear transport factor 2 family protein [Pseudolabrys sp.]|jgi:ketosteroid isomerase-like protein